MASSISSVLTLLVSQSKQMNKLLLNEISINEKLNLLSQLGGIGLYEVDVNRSVMTGNQIIRERLGVPLDESDIPLDLMFDSLEEDSAEAAKALVELANNLPNGYVNNSIEKQRFHDGSEHYIRILEHLEIRDGHPIFSGAAIDVTEVVVAKQKSEQSAIELQKKQDQQAQMYAVVGHELRTPAASLQMLLDDSERDGVLDRSLLKSNIEQLLSVIETLSAVAQPERMQQAAFKEVVLDELFSAQIQNLQGLASRNKIKLSTDLKGLVGEPVYIQASLLRQVTSNLLKNAILHSQGSQVTLSASATLAGDKLKRLQIRVADNGRGIPQESLSKVFEAFERGDSRAEGTGLGLFVCREIMHMMGGELRYETSESGGAEFIIDLSVSLAERDIKESLIPPDVLRGKRVLIAEDNAVIRMLTTKMLEKEDATVTALSDGQQALNAYSHGQFDLVMSDIFMPELDGYGLVKGLRAAGYTGPVIGLTAATIGTETDLMLQAGADFVISKPIDLLKVQQFLSDYEAQRNG
jgi:signal transduction histidine kinase